MKRAYFSKVIKNPTDFAKRKIEQHERKTILKMELKKKQYVIFHSKNPLFFSYKKIVKNSNFNFFSFFTS